MNLELVEIGRPQGERLWFPFTHEEAGLGFTRQWWYGNPVYPGSQSTFLRVMHKDMEVARVHLDDEVDFGHYAGVPRLGAAALDIQFIEVRDAHRLRGIGRTAIQLLQSRYPDRRLVAFSEGADGFWSSLGWSRHVHADPDWAQHYRPLFIQPEA